MNISKRWARKWKNNDTLTKTSASMMNSFWLRCRIWYVLNLSFLLFALIYFRREDRFCYFPVILIGIHLAQVLFLFWRLDKNKHDHQIRTFPRFRLYENKVSFDFSGIIFTKFLQMNRTVWKLIISTVPSLQEGGIFIMISWEIKIISCQIVKSMMHN